MKNKSKVKRRIVDYMLILLGAALYSLSVNIFTAPNNIAPGGITGVATIFNFLFQWPIGLLIFVLNIPLFIWGVVENGRHFLAKTVVATAAVSVFIDLSEPYIPSYNGDVLLAALFGGMLSGLGLALILYRGGTTGGTDIIARNIHNRMPYVSMGTIILAADAFVIVAAALVFQSLESGLYAVVAIFVSTKVIDSLIYGMAGDNGKLIFIVTERYEDISKEIMKRMVRGVTLLDAQGGYNNDEKKVVMCAVRPNQAYKINSLVKEIDENAFIIVTTAGAIKGNGFQAPEYDS